MRKTPSRHHSVPASYHHDPPRTHRRRPVRLTARQRIGVVAGVLLMTFFAQGVMIWLIIGVLAFHMLTRE